MVPSSLFLLIKPSFLLRTASFVHYTRYRHMASVLPTFKPRYRLSLPIIPFVPSYSSSIHEHLIPKPLKSKTSRPQLSTLHEHNELNKAPAQESKDALQGKEPEVTRKNEDRENPSGDQDAESASGNEKPVWSPLESSRSHSLPAIHAIQEQGGGLQPLYKCSLCHHVVPSNNQPYSFPSTHNLAHFGRDSDMTRPEGTGRVFCEACWIWIYNLAICWTCGEVVGRREERVGFGWCWWHWGCLGCLVCKVFADSPISHFANLSRKYRPLMN